METFKFPPKKTTIRKCDEMHVLKGIYRILHTFESYLYKILEKIIFVFFSLIVLSVAFQILYRFVIIKFISFSFPFTEEFSRYAMILVVYLTIPMVMKEGNHPSIDIVRNILSERGKNVLYFIIKAIIFFCLIIFMWYSIEVVKSSIIYTSPTLRLPGQYLYSCPLIGIVLMIFQFLMEVLGVLSGDEKPFANQSQKGDLA